MAKTLFLAPQAPRPPAGATAKPGHRSAPRSRAAPPHPLRSTAKPRAVGHGGLLVALAAAALAAGAAAWFWLGGPPQLDPSAQLLAEMEAAAQGSPVPVHVFGGALTVVQGNGRLNVVAEGVSSRACVQVGWRLARQGTIIVNGTLPTRLSAAKLSDLCSGDGATLTWVPDQ